MLYFLVFAVGFEAVMWSVFKSGESCRQENGGIVNYDPHMRIFVYRVELEMDQIWRRRKLKI